MVIAFCPRYYSSCYLISYYLIDSYACYQAQLAILKDGMDSALE
jgi:hypothetical protein